MTDELIEAFIQKWLDFDLQIREKRGLNEALLEELLDLLEEIKPQLEGSSAIPKNLAEIFLDMWGALTSSAELYSQAEQQKIFVAADQLTGCARDICTS